ncbi:hypothetical protein M9458_022367, partial [Cirrhinus mrigala]
AAIDPTVPDLGVGDVQVADHVPLRRYAVTDTVPTVLHDNVIVQRPGDSRLRSSLDVTRQGHKLVRTDNFLAEGGQDLR